MARSRVNFSFTFFITLVKNYFSRFGVVSKATRYGLEGPGIEYRWERFSAPIQTGSEAHPASCKMGTGSFPE